MGAKVGALWPCFHSIVLKIHLRDQCCFLSLSCSLSRSALWSLPWCAALPYWWRWFFQLWTFGVKMKMGSQRRTAAGTAGEKCKSTKTRFNVTAPQTLWFVTFHQVMTFLWTSVVSCSAKWYFISLSFVERKVRWKRCGNILYIIYFL